jgi:protein ImuB
MFACVDIPDFPVEAIVRAEPLLRERAVAVLEGKPPLTRIIALNEKARLLGLEAGMTKIQAAAFVPSTSSYIPQSGTTNKDIAVLRLRSPQQEAAAHAALLDASHSFTPRVEDTAPGVALLDLSGLERLYGAPARMAAELKARVSAVGLEANIAIAGNPDAAMHAARGFDGITVIPVGRELQRLGVLPIQILLDGFEISSPKVTSGKASDVSAKKLREQMLDTLERWGVRDFRTLALLPEHALASRLGQAGTQLRRLARGESMRPLSLCEPRLQFEEAMELEVAVENIESLGFLLNRLLEQLCARLEARALAAQELRLRLQLEPRVTDEADTTVEELAGAESHTVVHGTFFERSLRLPVAMRDPKIFLKLLQLDLAAHPPGAPVTKLWLWVQPSRPRTAQRGLFLPISPEPEKLEITLARINAIVGERRAGIARLLDTHRPDSFGLERFATIDNTNTLTLSETDEHPPLAMRIIRPAYQLNVQVADGKPVWLASEGSRGDRKPLQGQIDWLAGPWRSSGDWWTDTKGEQSGAWDREEWDVALGTPAATNGDERHAAIYRIYRDLGTGQWFADASYD